MISTIGRYFLFFRNAFIGHIKPKVLFSRVIEECVDIGLKSTILTIVVSAFIGIVCCFQTNNTVSSPLLSKTVVAVGLRNMIILELSPTLIGIIFAGKNGSFMASQITSMRISEQIDALNVMGINYIQYLILPKIIASTIMYPMLVVLSCFCSLLSGYLLAVYYLNIPGDIFIRGYQTIGGNTYIDYLLIKSIIFGFLISLVSTYSGAFTKGQGEIAVGEASKVAFTKSCVLILIFDYILSIMIL